MKEVITVNNMRQSDESTIKNGIPSRELMFRAAMGVYNSFEWNGRIGIFCGSGNNAGDGYALALILKKNGFDPEIIITSEKCSSDGRYYYELCLDEKIVAKKFEEINEKYDIAVDCLLGTGFKGEVNERISKVIDYINSVKTVISVDINSGLNGDNGLGKKVVKSDLTVSIGTLKTGLFLNQAKDYIKEIMNKDIGIEIMDKPFYLIEDTDAKKIIKKRPNFSNKGTYGYVGIMGGSKSYPGAIRLANMGQTALYSGSGVSKIIVPEEIYELVFSNVLESVVYSLPSKDGKMIFSKEEIDKSISGLKALGVGVGWDKSSEYSKILEYLINNTNIPIVIDADGINTLSLMDLDSLKFSDRIILTPHLKEFSRLTGKTIEEINENSIAIVLDFVSKYDVTLLLKGPTTIVANRKNLYLINKGCSGMATAGSGDVLTGIIVSLLGYSKEEYAFTVAVGAYINGLSGEYAQEKYGEIGMVSGDTARSISFVIKDLLEKEEK